MGHLVLEVLKGEEDGHQFLVIYVPRLLVNGPLTLNRLWVVVLQVVEHPSPAERKEASVVTTH